MKLVVAAILAGFVVLSEALRLPDPSWAVQILPPPSKRFRNLLNINGLRDDAKCNGTVFGCQDCRNSLICRPKDDNSIVTYTTIPCPANRPYCDVETGSCTSKVRLDCGAADNFICTRKNHYFPDSDCKKFHYCDDKYQAKLFQCTEDGTTFNADKQSCEPSSECGKFDCSGNDLKKVTHSEFQRYYAMCKTLKNDDSPLVVAVCPPQFVLDRKTQDGCIPDCATLGKGNIPDPKDCNQYWTCTKEVYPNGESFVVAKHLTCVTGEYFDADLRICVPGVPPKEKCKTTHY